MTHARIAVPVIVLSLLVAAASLGQDGCLLVERDYGPDGRVPIRVEAVVTGLEVPWALAFLPGGDLLVTERAGRIRRVANGRLQPEPVARISVEGGEGGLLGLALHPGFAENRLFFIYFTVRKAGAAVNRVERWKLATDGRSAERERLILDDIPAARFHDGGRLRIGPDGMLYVGTGDAGEPARAQDRESLAGKLLRLTPEGRVPPDNPFPGSPVFLWGIRNTQGFDWLDADTLVVTDHGPSGELGRSGHDEVNVARKGANLGWPTVYGCQQSAGMVAPRLTWTRAAPPGGAALYTGQNIAGWRGSLLIGTLGSRHLHRVVAFQAGRVEHEVYLRGDPPDGYGRLRDVIMGPDGHLYVTTSNCDGRGRCPRDGDKVLRLTRR
ncbi:MAG TPA: PQQ-dependent sugar dehydrogenase [Methylomirabilota bacterium]|jgi:glucose/arabinose dehydrogenase|nr:PQQ-dependent sugar dehydrogenase [Methylomirabilota bacterium]